MASLIFTLKEIKLLRLHNSDMKRLLLPLLAALVLPACATKTYESKEKAGEACVAWWKEGGDFYVREGEGYNMVTKRFPIRRCFVDEENKTIVGRELTQIKADETLLGPLNIGEGKATPETKKKFKFK